MAATSTGRTFSWDVFNRLTQATGPGGTVTYTYDGDGLKRQRVGPDGTRRHYSDGIKPIWETDAAGTMTAQLDRDLFGNLLSRREASGARRYYHFDGLGSTTALTNESGAATSTLLYDAWGNQRAATGADQGRYRFTGAELDAATGLYHMGARFYDPTLGRWLSEDPVQDKYFEPFTLNFYAYVTSNPLVLVDSDGHAAVVAALALGISAPALGIVALGVGAVVAVGVASYYAGGIAREHIDAMASRERARGNVGRIDKKFAPDVASDLRRPGGRPPEFHHHARELIAAFTVVARHIEKSRGRLEAILEKIGTNKERLKEIIDLMKNAGIWDDFVKDYIEKFGTDPTRFLP